MRVLRVVLLVAAIAALVSCSSSKKSSSSAVSLPAAAPDTVTIKSFAFSPSSVSVAAGAVVSVINADGVTHTVTSDDKKSFDTGHVSGGASATFIAPSAPGTYRYHCTIHNYMKATIIVH
jgi:plastocyanin